MTNILLIDGHPDADPARYVHALAKAYGEAAKEAGHAVQRIDLAALDFPMLRSFADWSRQPPPPAIAEAQEAIRWAEHIVIFFPLWLGEAPAMLKAFLEQVARPGFALAQGNMPKPLLGGRSARLVVTMGMPTLLYRLWFRAHGVRSLTRNILKFAGIRPVHTTLIGGVEGSPAARVKWLERMKQFGARAG